MDVGYVQGVSNRESSMICGSGMQVLEYPCASDLWTCMASLVIGVLGGALWDL